MANPIVYEIEPNQIILADLPDQCKISYEDFEQDDGMQHHIETVQEEQKSNKIAHDKENQTRKDSFKCKICDKTFSSRGSLKTHIAGVHDLCDFSCV